MWPDDGDLPVRVEAAFGADLTADPATWVWTDLSSRMTNTPITIRVPADQFSPGTCSVTLLNDDGALTPLHPASPYWPHVELGTPLRVRVQWDGVWHDRFSGFADQWQPTFIPITTGESASAVRVTCSGILRRLTQGEQPSQSAMRRTIAASGALAYWPLEDGADAGQAASAYPGHAPMSITGPISFADIESWTTSKGYTVEYGTAALADIAGGAALTAPAPADVTSATAAEWTVAVTADVAVPASRDLILAEVATTGGTYTLWRLVVTTTAHLQIQAVDGSGSTVVAVDINGVTTAMLVHSFAVWQSGGSLAVGYNYNSVLGWEGTGTVPGTAVGGITRVSINPTRTTLGTPVPAGHLAVWAGHAFPAIDGADGPVARALYAFGVNSPGTSAAAATGEPATQRLARLAAEDGIALAVPAVDPSDEVMMGVQKPGTALDLYRECVDADLGVLYEDGFGLAYLPRAARYNPPVDLTIDLAVYAVTGSGDVLKSVYDDQGVRTRWTVQRRDGSSAVADDPASQRWGVYSDSVELNLASDAGLMDQASWRVHLGTTVGLREDTVPIDLAANPELVDGWLSCGVGSRIVRVNPPEQYPGPLDRLVQGWSETIGPRSWLVQVTPSLALPWDVAVEGSARYGADGSTLAASLSPSATTMQVATPAGGRLWTTDPAEYPQDLRVGPWRVTVTAMSGTASPQTAVVTAIDTYGATDPRPAGTAVDVWQPPVAAL